MARTSKRLGWAALILLAGFGAVHLASTLWFGWARMAAPPRPLAQPEAMTTGEERVVSALVRVLAEDDVPDAARWARAIVRAAPTDDLGYIALVTAQVRRESHFLATDLEWLYAQLVPDLVHELGVPDPVRTIGPMQVQRWRLTSVFERTLGRELHLHEVKELAAEVEVAVAACVAVLDPIVRDHVPERRIGGWASSVGAAGMSPPLARVLARDWLGTMSPERPRLALSQKMLSDLTRVPLALDGLLGERTYEVAALLPAPPQADEDGPAVREVGAPPPDLAAVRRQWEARFAAHAPTEIPPRIAHDPRLAFVLADFHTGRGAAQTAALQLLLRDLLGSELAVDGKPGPATTAATRQLFAGFEPDAARRADFLALIDAGHKPRWVRTQAWDLAARHWRARHGTEPPRALVPDLWHDGVVRRLKGIGRISVEGYVAGSVAFFEDYYARLAIYTGSLALPRSH